MKKLGTSFPFFKEEHKSAVGVCSLTFLHVFQVFQNRTGSLDSLPMALWNIINTRGRPSSYKKWQKAILCERLYTLISKPIIILIWVRTWNCLTSINLPLWALTDLTIWIKTRKAQDYQQGSVFWFFLASVLRLLRICKYKIFLLLSPFPLAQVAGWHRGRWASRARALLSCLRGPWNVSSHESSACFGICYYPNRVST